MIEDTTAMAAAPMIAALRLLIGTSEEFQALGEAAERGSGVYNTPLYSD